MNLEEQLYEAGKALHEKENELRKHIENIWDGYKGRILYDYYDNSIELEGVVVREQHKEALGYLGFMRLFFIGVEAMNSHALPWNPAKDSFAESLFNLYHREGKLDDSIFDIIDDNFPEVCNDTEYDWKTRTLTLELVKPYDIELLRSYGFTNIVVKSSGN